MTKILLLVLVVVAIVLLWRGARARDAAPPSQAARKPAAQAPTMQMVRCKVCQVHLPRADAILAPAGAYCSDAHYRQDAT